MKPTKVKTPKDTPTAQHARFVKTAGEVQASDDPEDFERAFKKIGPVKSHRKKRS
jgi:hypothetical protein